MVILLTVVFHQVKRGNDFRTKCKFAEKLATKRNHPNKQNVFFLQSFTQKFETDLTEFTHKTLILSSPYYVRAKTSTVNNICNLKVIGRSENFHHLPHSICLAETNFASLLETQVPIFKS